MLKLTHPIIDIDIVCSDFEKSLHFYRDLLGLEIAAELEISAAGVVCTPDPDGILIELVQVDPNDH